jgi:hypothetical protein
VREVTTFTVVGDVLEGQYDTLYATYYGYDEIAHHSGIADHDVFGVLKQLNKQFKRIESAREFADVITFILFSQIMVKAMGPHLNSVMAIPSKNWYADCFLQIRRFTASSPPTKIIWNRRSASLFNIP